MPTPRRPGPPARPSTWTIALTECVDPDTVRAPLDAALPEGLDVIECREARPGALADRLQASVWEVRFHDVDPRVVSDAVDRFVAVDRAEVTRMGKSGLRTFDTRGAVVAMRVIEAGCAILRVVVRHTTPAVRPDDILSALRAVGGLEPPAPPLVTRLAQGPLHSGDASVADPLAPEENVAGAVTRCRAYRASRARHDDTTSVGPRRGDKTHRAAR